MYFVDDIFAFAMTNDETNGRCPWFTPGLRSYIPQDGKPREGFPQSYSEAFDILGENKILDPSFAYIEDHL